MERAAEKALSEMLKLFRKISAIATALADMGAADEGCVVSAAALLPVGKMPGGVDWEAVWDAAGALRG